ncbi:tyrosine-type recombinase/integrase [Natronoarchaeum mannanilyticum]|uniref:Core-binding (CB) domain-containing protein n=1 Tax=Natronoarchaeum mannanilyticum TaxID=926360 RepID=A0AAV3TAP7_9EURY
MKEVPSDKKGVPPETSLSEQIPIGPPLDGTISATTMHDEQVTPETAIEEYLESRTHEISESTLQNLRYRLKQFRLWAEDAGIEDMRELDGHDCERWKLARVNAGLAPITIQMHMRSFRQFIRWCGIVGYTEEALHELIRIPDVNKDDRRRDDALSFKRAKRIKSYLQKFEYGSFQHILFGIFWHTAMRMGSARALDVDDIEYADDGTMYLAVRHRPETDTPLKLGSEGERNVSVSDPELASAVDDYVQHQRPDVVDEYERTPLLTTRNGRASKTKIRVSVYRTTQPCLMDDCPHGKDPKTCEFLSHNKAGGCPSAVSPHAIRRSAITAHLDQGIPKEIVSERASVSVDTLTEHYDVRSKEMARTTRQEYIDDLRF